MAERIKGSVKWFNNRKGFGFITPTSDNAPTEDDIFCHVSDIVISETTKYRTLKDGFETEFEVVTDDNGKLRAVSITSADGSPCPEPEPRQRRQRNKTDENGEAVETTSNEDQAEDGGNAKRTRSRKKRNNGAKSEGDDENGGDNNSNKPPSWETGLEEGVQVAMKSKDLKVDGGRAFLSIGDARLKLGTDGYAALAHAEGVLAEGTWTVEPNGIVTTTWDRVLKLGDSEWVLSVAVDETEFLMTEINLSDVLVEPTGATETTNSLWGEDKEDPKDALETNGFLMRRMVLNAGQAGRRRGRGRQRRYANKNKGNQTAE